MAKKKLRAELSIAGIESIKQQLIQYRDVDLPQKCENLVKNLGERGIAVGKKKIGKYGTYVIFSISTQQEATGCKCIVLATNTGIIKSEWRTKDGVKSADVSPLLMCEFGSGLQAKNPMNVPGVGTGTFPEQTHATDPNGWWYMDLAGEWHHSYGITPKMPMYKAAMEMHKKVVTEAKKVFK